MCSSQRHQIESYESDNCAVSLSFGAHFLHGLYYVCHREDLFRYVYFEIFFGLLLSLSTFTLFLSAAPSRFTVNSKFFLLVLRREKATPK